MAGIYKAYDIRGIVPGELDRKTAYLIGRAVSVFLAEVRCGQSRHAADGGGDGGRSHRRHHGQRPRRGGRRTLSTPANYLPSGITGIRAA